MKSLVKEDEAPASSFFKRGRCTKMSQSKLFKILTISSVPVLTGSYFFFANDEKFFSKCVMPATRLLDAEIAHVLAVKAMGFKILPWNNYKDPESLVSFPIVRSASSVNQTKIHHRKLPSTTNCGSIIQSVSLLVSIKMVKPLKAWNRLVSASSRLAL